MWWFFVLFGLSIVAAGLTGPGLQSHLENFQNPRKEQTMKFNTLLNLIKMNPLKKSKLYQMFSDKIMQPEVTKERKNIAEDDDENQSGNEPVNIKITDQDKSDLNIKLSVKLNSQPHDIEHNIERDVMNPYDFSPFPYIEHKTTTQQKNENQITLNSNFSIKTPEDETAKFNIYNQPHEHSFEKNTAVTNAPTVKEYEGATLKVFNKFYDPSFVNKNVALNQAVQDNEGATLKVYNKFYDNSFVNKNEAHKQAVKDKEYEGATLKVYSKFYDNNFVNKNEAHNQAVKDKEYEGATLKVYNTFYDNSFVNKNEAHKQAVKEKEYGGATLKVFDQMYDTGEAHNQAIKDKEYEVATQVNYDLPYDNNNFVRPLQSIKRMPTGNEYVPSHVRLHHILNIDSQNENSPTQYHNQEQTTPSYLRREIMNIFENNNEGRKMIRQLQYDKINGDFESLLSELHG